MDEPAKLKMNSLKPVTHIIFDMDGLLLDTEPLYSVATNSVVDEYGKTFTWEIKSRMMGRRLSDAARIIIDTEKIHTVAIDEIVTKYGKTFTWEINSRMMGRRQIESAKIIIDTEKLYTVANNKVVGEYGKLLTWDISVQMLGRKQKDWAKIIIDELELPLTTQEYIGKCIKQYDILFPSVGFMPGAEKLVRHLHKHNIPMAVATGSTGYNYKLKITKHTEVFNFFKHVVLSSDDPEVTHGKPAPDCFLICAKRFKDNPPPEKVLVFEDANNGVDAAVDAGMQVVWIPDERADQSKHKDKATLILKSLEEFNPEDFGLPAYDS